MMPRRRVSASLSTLLLGTPSGAADVNDEPADDALTEAIASALAAEEADRAFASITADPAALIAERRLELLAASSPGWAHERMDALAGFVASSERLRSSVQVVDSSRPSGLFQSSEIARTETRKGAHMRARVPCTPAHAYVHTVAKSFA